MAASRLSNFKGCLSSCGLLALLASLGCQADYAGQTLPSPYWQTDDVQFFPPGPEFKLSQEAAAMKTYGTGRPARRAPGLLGPAGAPVPSGELDGAAPVPAPAVPPGVAPPAGAPAAEAAPDAGAVPPANEPDADPFAP